MGSLFSLAFMSFFLYTLFYNIKKAKQNRESGEKKNYQNSSTYVAKPGSTLNKVIVAKPTSTISKVAVAKQTQQVASKVVGEKHAGFDLSGDKMERVQSGKKRIIAKRLYEGDRPPKGCVEKVCGYCGASNIIPTYSFEKYACYFCHEKI